jgi:hypothetical protein
VTVCGSTTVAALLLLLLLTLPSTRFDPLCGGWISSAGFEQASSAARLVGSRALSREGN